MLRGILFYKLENMMVGVGPQIRNIGQHMFRQGMTLQGPSAHEDTLVPSLRCVATSPSKYPKLLDGDWVAPNATVIGDVTLGEGSSLWHGVIVRGDNKAVTIGKNTTVQDLTRIASNVTVGDNVYIAANCALEQNSKVMDNSFIGMGATVGVNGSVEPFAVLAAGAHLLENTTLPSGQVWAGAPAAYLRDVTQEEKHLMGEHKLEMQQMAEIYAEETEKTFREQLDSMDARIKYRRQDPMQRMIEKLGDVGMPSSHDDMEYIEHRIYHDYVGTADFQIKDEGTEHGSYTKRWTPYEQDLSNYPEVFKKYQENYAAYDAVKERFENEDIMEEQGEGVFKKQLPKDMSPWEKKYEDVQPRYTGTLCQ